MCLALPQHASPNVCLSWRVAVVVSCLQGLCSAGHHQQALLFVDSLSWVCQRADQLDQPCCIGAAGSAVRQWQSYKRATAGCVQLGDLHTAHTMLTGAACSCVHCWETPQRSTGALPGHHQILCMQCRILGIVFLVHQLFCSEMCMQPTVQHVQATPTLRSSPDRQHQLQHRRIM